MRGFPSHPLSRSSKERAVIPRCREIRPEKYEVQAEKKSSSKSWQIYFVYLSLNLFSNMTGAFYEGMC